MDSEIEDEDGIPDRWRVWWWREVWDADCAVQCVDERSLVGLKGLNAEFTSWQPIFMEF